MPPPNENSQSETTTTSAERPASGGTSSGSSAPAQALKGSLVGQPFDVQLSMLSPDARRPVQRKALGDEPTTPAEIARAATEHFAGAAASHGDRLVQRDLVADINSTTTAAERDDDRLRAIFRAIDALSHADLVTTVNAVRAHLTVLLRIGAGIGSNAALTRLAVVGNSRDYLQQLGRGTYTWADTTAEADAVITAIETCDGGFANGMNFLAQFQADGSINALAARAGTASHSKVAAWLGRRAGPARELGIKSWFDNAPNSSLDVLQACMGTYFGFDVGQYTVTRSGMDWSAAGLRRTWGVLAGLPPGDVNLIDLLGRYDTAPTTVEGLGGESGGRSVVAMGYGSRTDLARGTETSNNMVQPGDPLYGRNRFDSTVRHEVGHVVGARLSFESGTARGDAFGGWRTYSGWRAVAEEMITATGDVTRGVLRGKAGLTGDFGAIPDGAAWFLDQATSALENRNEEWGLHIGTDIEFWSQLNADEQRRISRDPIFSAVRKAAGGGWVRDDGGDTVGDRKYNVISSENAAFSYLAAARARKVSKYQFKAPGEWFAEAYSTYYDPADGPARLAGRDANTKQWFDTHVNGRR